jgi:sugar/nucleoside kinase (ribokinase family)
MSQFDITIAGEINLDLILYGLPEQMPLDRELLASNFSLTLGSSSAILAHNLAALGVKVGFATKVGSDPLGKLALDLMSRPNLTLSHPYPKVSDQTGVTLLLHHGKARHILTYMGVMAEMSANDLDMSFIAPSHHFHLSSLFLQKSLQRDLPCLFRELKERGLTISLDTNDDPDDLWGEPLGELLGLIDVLLPNEDEAKRMMRTDDLDEAIKRLARQVPIVAVKCGSRGSIVQAGAKRYVAIPLQVEPVDTIGAGDSFNAGFLKAYLQGLPLDQCAAVGNASAAFSTLRPGGTEAFRDQEFLCRFLQENSKALDSSSVCSEPGERFAKSTARAVSVHFPDKS